MEAVRGSSSLHYLLPPIYTYYLLMTNYYHLQQVRGSSSMHSLALGHNPHVIGEATEARGLPP